MGQARTHQSLDGTAVIKPSPPSFLPERWHHRDIIIICLVWCWRSPWFWQHISTAADKSSVLLVNPSHHCQYLTQTSKHVLKILKNLYHLLESEFSKWVQRLVLFFCVIIIFKCNVSLQKVSHFRSYINVSHFQHLSHHRTQKCCSNISANLTDDNSDDDDDDE